MKMKVVLLKDVPGLGQKYDVKEVSGGYARNFLFLQGLAEPADEKRIKKIEVMKKQREEERAVEEDILNKNIEALDGLKISIAAKANEKGHLFAKIHREEIARALDEEKQIKIPAELIELEEPIKETGEYKIKVRDKEFVLEVKNE